MDSQVSIASKTLHLESHQLDCEFQRVIDYAVDSINLPSINEELKLLLKFYITNRLLNNGKTIGSNIYKLNLVHSNSSGLLSKPNSNNVLLFNTLEIIFPYLLRRKENIKDHLSKVLGKHDATWIDADNLILLSKAASVINFLVFLFEGKYLTISERISRMIPIIFDKDYFASIAINRVQMELLSRELIWRELANFITTVIPYIQTGKIRHKLLQVFSKFGLMRTERKEHMDINHQVDLHQCGICQSQPFNPYSIGCRHIFCYYCLESRHLLDSKVGYSCTKCNYVTNDSTDVQRHKVYASLSS